MGVSTCSAASHFMCWEGTQNLAFCMQFESPPQQKLHRVNHMGLNDAIRSSSHPPYEYKEDYETLQQQWVCPHVVHHSILCAERVLKIWHFVYNLRVALGENVAVYEP